MKTWLQKLLAAVGLRPETGAHLAVAMLRGAVASVADFFSDERLEAMRQAIEAQWDARDSAGQPLSGVQKMEAVLDVMSDEVGAYGKQLRARAS
ncbi:hypothetical protein [Thiococcus pfennigii]|uniref:hypothetical protein n=1 Tax=Thiococcus pfennigii TaxID=1057 RepID=UPI0019073487|nr:hypothetical protein [Thiococcus pfennigii]MBK1699740.1 hypothetical protein [Thiococcus pfennigii]